MAVLVVCDDGKNTGEEVRIRHEEFIIGRSEGDYQLPIDEMLSARHFAISRQLVRGKWRWAITDLQSRNGTFFRVSSAILTNKMEFLIGSGKYRYHRNPDAVPETHIDGDVLENRPTTKAQQSEEKPGAAFLTEIVRTGNGARVALTRDALTIGASPRCDIRRGDDAYTDSTHATLTKTDAGFWTITNNGTRNGVWVRLPQVSVGGGGTCEFQAGEQKFRLVFGARR